MTEKYCYVKAYGPNNPVVGSTPLFCFDISDGMEPYGWYDALKAWKTIDGQIYSGIRYVHDYYDPWENKLGLDIYLTPGDKEPEGREP